MTEHPSVSGPTDDEPDPGPSRMFPAVNEPHSPSRRSLRERDRARRRANGPMAWAREIAIILISALVLSWVVKTFFVQAFYIPSPSMNDTLVLNDRILVSKLTPRVFDLHRGDIVVFSDPGGWLAGTVVPQPNRLTQVLGSVGLAPANSDHLVKRVIGLPGDHVACAGEGSPITVNGVAIDESSYIKPGSVPSEMAFDVVVPKDHIWVMGDNRQESSDSRYHQDGPAHGTVPISDVVGVVFVTIWPVDRLSTHRNPGSVFAHVPDPS